MQRPRFPNADPPRARSQFQRVESDGLAAAAAIAAASFSAVINTHLPKMFVFSRPFHDRAGLGAADGSAA